MSRFKSIICMIACMATAMAVSGQTKRMAVTALSENMLRAMPDYESALETQALMGTVVEIAAEKGYWRQINTPEPYTAWCTEPGLVEMTPEQINEYKAAPKYICIVPHGSVYSKPSETAPRLSDLSMGNLLRIVYADSKKEGIRHGKVSRKGKWVEVMLPDGRTGWTLKTDVNEFAQWVVKRKITEETIVSTALQFTGTPYLWGGASSKGLDCSGLVRMTFFMNGHLLPRNASQQVNYGREIIMECDHSIDAGSDKLYREMLERTKNLKPGDLVFFGSPETLLSKEKITHVGIYIGNGKIIHASHKVRINSLIPGEKDYYENSHRLLKARRMVGWQGKGMTPVIHSSAYFLW